MRAFNAGKRTHKDAIINLSKMPKINHLLEYQKAGAQSRNLVL